ncbi:MAG: hypothetical protein A2W03_10925 [Candidatus Aminicenantes bacterium RBG_16_63_16]|nr:MAG: hypothetical protein A2W03_10925 [Candidatus Aminicenantes bacterium RBG_16_63_16]
MKKTILLGCLAALVSAAPVAGSLAEPVVSYQFQVRLDPAQKTVAGSENLTWLNTSGLPVSELQFHLYLNAFKNNRTTLMKESGAAYREIERQDEDWGYVTVHKIEVGGGPDLTPSVAYIQPDDGNPDDQTVMKVALPYPVNPGEKIALRIEFTSKLPKVTRRSGFSGDFFMVAQWFPKIGVLQDTGWNCHQYHANSEFFADYGEFKAEITVPEKYVVGATGKRLEDRINDDGTKTYVHEQADVHDFAWTACPDFREFREKYVLDMPRVQTEMILLIHEAHLNQKDRYSRALRQGLEFYSRNYGAYPYETITLVDPAPGAGGAGGMEYPTLFTGMTMSWLPRGWRITELVTIHEFGHGYWYGIVGSNEFEEAWLDEGINTYSEIKAMDHYYGEEALDIGGLKISDQAFGRVTVIASGRFDPIVKKSWEYIGGGSYSLNVYQKAGLMTLTLEKILGEDVMGRVMRTYYERWKFRHPTTRDFVAVAEEVSGRDLGWFFNQVLYSPDKLDYAVGSLTAREIVESQGVFGEKIQAPAKPHKDAAKDGGKAKTYRNEVVVARRGEWIIPQDILITFENGETVRETWDGRDRWKRFVYRKETKVLSAVIDPDRKMVLDVSYANNSMTLKPKKAGILKLALGFMSWVQGFLTLAAI